MKTLDNKALIYDSNCPLCCWYTNKFIQIGALERNGRISFNELAANHVQQLDAHRSRHEIPLLDTQTGKVEYGIDGLTLILANVFPYFKSILTNTYAKRLVKPLYNFISYNRRIIVPSRIADHQKIDCTPDFHLGWRLTLITLCLGLYYTLILSLKTQLSVYGINLFLVYPLIHLAFIFFITKPSSKQNLWNALGDFSVSNLSSVLLFSPFFLLNYLLPDLSVYFMITVFIVFQIRLMLHVAKRIENKKYLVQAVFNIF